LVCYLHIIFATKREHLRENKASVCGGGKIFYTWPICDEPGTHFHEERGKEELLSIEELGKTAVVHLWLNEFLGDVPAQRRGPQETPQTKILGTAPCRILGTAEARRTFPPIPRWRVGGPWDLLAGP
jgi:hypothetical protein